MTDPLPTDPVPPRRRRLPRVVRWAVTAAALVGIAWLGLFLLLLWHHRTTPDFASYLARHPTSAQTLAAPAGSVPLGSGGEWRIGEVDPFAVDEDDPRLERHSIRWEVDLHHGEAVMLRLVQEVAVAADRATGERRGAGARTHRLEVGPGLRAVPRILLVEPDRMLEAGYGEVAFTVLLGAGTGPSAGEVRSAPAATLAAVWPEAAVTPRILLDFLQRLWPWASPPDDGLLHRLSATARLSFRRLDNGSQGASIGEVHHAVNTAEYSYDLRAALIAAGPGSRISHEITRQNLWRWNGEVW